MSLLLTTLVLVVVVVALLREALRPGLVLLSGAIVLMCFGIITPREMLEGFSNKGMITVALLFLVSEGVRRSGLLEGLSQRLLPAAGAGLLGVKARLLPAVAAISAFLNNTPVVVIFAPLIKQRAQRLGLPAQKLLIPLSYATILGGMCTLIGTSTNLVVHGLALETAALNPASGVRGLTMFELGQVGGIIALVGTLYLLASSRLLPSRPSVAAERLGEEHDNPHYFRIEVVLAARFPAIGRRVRDFDFKRKYGATLLEIKRGSQTLLMHDMRKEHFREGDTLVLLADEAFLRNWGDSSFFLMVSDGREAAPRMSRPRRYLTAVLLLLMVGGAALGELPAAGEWLPGVRADMFFFVCLTTVVMAWTGLFPARKYTKFISWDILVTIASAFALSRAMVKSGVADGIATQLLAQSHDCGPYLMLALCYLITNLFTELMTNNAAAALTYPIALAVAQHLGVNPMPFVVCICIAASASFCSPIGYQTNLIVQSVGGYRFTDFLRVGLPLSLLVFALSVWLIPVFWPF